MGLEPIVATGKGNRGLGPEGPIKCLGTANGPSTSARSWGPELLRTAISPAWQGMGLEANTDFI